MENLWYTKTADIRFPFLFPQLLQSCCLFLGALLELVTHFFPIFDEYFYVELHVQFAYLF